MPKISKLNLITLPSSPKPNSVAMEIEKPEHPKGPWAKLQHKVGPVSRLQLIWFPYEAFPSGMTLPNRWLRGPALSRIPISALLHLYTVTHILSDAVFKTAEELDWKSFSGEWIQTIQTALFHNPVFL